MCCMYVQTLRPNDRTPCAHGSDKNPLFDILVCAKCLFSPGAIPLTGLVVLNARQVVHVGSFNSCGNCRGYFYAGPVPLTWRARSCTAGCAQSSSLRHPGHPPRLALNYLLWFFPEMILLFYSQCSFGPKEARLPSAKQAGFLSFHSALVARNSGKLKAWDPRN